MTLRFAMRARDVDCPGVVYRRWTVDDAPDLDALLYDGPRCGGSPLADVTIEDRYGEAGGGGEPDPHEHPHEHEATSVANGPLVIVAGLMSTDTAGWQVMGAARVDASGPFVFRATLRSSTHARTTLVRLWDATAGAALGSLTNAGESDRSLAASLSTAVVIAAPGHLLEVHAALDSQPGGEVAIVEWAGVELAPA